MADPNRKFESETIGRSGLQPVRAKSETRDLDDAGSGTLRGRERRDKAQIKVIVLRLIDHFEQDLSVVRDA
jgi:hypothetical protein